MTDGAARMRFTHAKNNRTEESEMALREKCAYLTVAACLAAGPGIAQEFPSKPVRLVVGSTPGGGTDISARLIAPLMAEHLGQQIIVENRPGATTTIGVNHVVRSAPDGYTMLMGVSSLAINPH